MTLEWAPYCADTIADKGHTIRTPSERLGALWVSGGGGGGTAHVYRVVPREQYQPPAPDLPMTYEEHIKSRYRYQGYEGVIVTWKKREHVLTDEHTVSTHPYVADPKCLRGECCRLRPAEPDDHQRRVNDYRIPSRGWQRLTPEDWKSIAWTMRWRAEYVDRGNPDEWITPTWREWFGLTHYTPAPWWTPTDDIERTERNPWRETLGPRWTVEALQPTPAFTPVPEAPRPTPAPPPPTEAPQPAAAPTRCCEHDDWLHTPKGCRGATTCKCTRHRRKAA